mmetsp:Transcript_40803/g.83467  ORF Transcript_40803/g.83467 Transcript_40803/m.83467 type:complete len:115 (-) Transcript_40803:210-554(-)
MLHCGTPPTPCRRAPSTLQKGPRHPAEMPRPPRPPQRPRTPILPRADPLPPRVRDALVARPPPQALPGVGCNDNRDAVLTAEERVMQSEGAQQGAPVDPYFTAEEEAAAEDQGR